MSSQRHLQRIAVMQTLFAHEFVKGRADPEEVLDYNLEEFDREIPDADFARDLLRGVFAHIGEIHKIISEKAKEWPIEKISPVDRALLEIGIYEILHSKDVPSVVAIDEAIEIAKAYGSENSAKFINGVLSAVMKDKEISYQ